MTDTPEHIRKLQLEIWLAKTPEERLYEAVKSNGELFLFFQEGKRQLEEMAKVEQLQKQQSGE